MSRSSTPSRDGRYYPNSSQFYNAVPRITSSPRLISEIPKIEPWRRSGRDWDLWDDYWADRRYFMSPLARPYQSHNRRYYYLDPPYGLRWHYPALPWYPKLGNRQVALMEQVDPLYTRRYRDPNYDQPIWQTSRRWAHDVGHRTDIRRMLQMYRQKLIDYDTLHKNWLAPFSLERKISEYERHPKNGDGQYENRARSPSVCSRF